LHDQDTFAAKDFTDVQLCLVGGGIVERNQVIMEGDKLVASLCVPRERRRKRDRKRDKKKKHKRSKPKKAPGF